MDSIKMYQGMDFPVQFNLKHESAIKCEDVESVYEAF